MACDNLTSQDAVLTVQECEAVVHCIQKLEKKVLPPDRQQADGPIPYPTSRRQTHRTVEEK